MLFSDALVVGGMLSHEEIATRSSIGFYVYSPPGENERLMERAGFRQIRVTDTTESAARVAKRWHQAREKRKQELIAHFAEKRNFLFCVDRGRIGHKCARLRTKKLQPQIVRW